MLVMLEEAGDEADEHRLLLRLDEEQELLVDSAGLVSTLSS